MWKHQLLLCVLCNGQTLNDTTASTSILGCQLGKTHYMSNLRMAYFKIKLALLGNQKDEIKREIFRMEIHVGSDANVLYFHAVRSSWNSQYAISTPFWDWLCTSALLTAPSELKWYYVHHLASGKVIRDIIMDVLWSIGHLVPSNTYTGI